MSPAAISAFSSSRVMAGDRTLPGGVRANYGRPGTPMPELAAIIARLEPELGRAGGRSPARSRAASPTATTACGWAARTSSCACAIAAPRCWGSIARTEEIAVAPRRRRGHRPAGRRLPERRAGARHALAAGRRRGRRAHAHARASWPRSPRCCAGCTPRRRCRARSRSSGSSRSSARCRRACPTATSACSGLPHRIEAGGHRPRARAGLLPQRPADRQLRARRRARVHRRLGVRGHERPLLRPRQPVGQQRLRGRATTARCSSCTSTSR